MSASTAEKASASVVSNKKSGIGGVFSKIFKVIFHPVVRLLVEALVFCALIALVFIGSVSEVPFLKSHQFFTVLSGSMEPTIMTGSMILVDKSEAPVNKGDIVTFFTPRTKQLTTHRILNTTYDEKIKKNLYSTKGDNNQDPDPWILNDENITGHVRFSIPYAGYLVSFARTPKGFFLLAVLPGLLLIADEIWKVKKVMQQEYEKKITALKAELSESKKLSS